jgi:3-hydroxyisobutyrate dehydrogenase
MPHPHITFLGLGTMGAGMARRLLAAGFPLTVFNRDPAKTAPFLTEGAKTASTPREAAANATIVISMLADDHASRSLWLGDTGALASIRPDTILIESSTVTLSWIKELSAAAAQKSCHLLDAPVTGSKPQAASGELTFLVGGPAEILERARPALAAMSKAIIHLGPTGSGALLKLINNFLCGVQAASLAEATALIEKSGLDPAKSFDLLTNGAPGSPLIKTLSARMAARDFTPPNFLLRLMAKDLHYAAAEGHNLSIDLKTAQAAESVFKSAIAAGDGDRDLSAVVQQFRAK